MSPGNSGSDGVGPDRPRVVILGAGRPSRGDQPSALHYASGNLRVLDWIIGAFNSVMQPEIHFVGGHRVKDITDVYPDIFVALNPNWESQGSLGSLLAASYSPGQSLYVCYADIVFSEDTVRALHDADGDVVIVTDTTWKHRYEGRSAQDLGVAEKVRVDERGIIQVDPQIPVDQARGEFIGLLKLSPRAVDHLIALRAAERHTLAQHGIPTLVQKLKESGLVIRSREIEGKWAELNAPQDLAHFILGTKAETLERLRPLVQESVIGRQVQFTVAAWNADHDSVLKSVLREFGDTMLIVRSSALSEDGWQNSNAGGFTSVLAVPGTDSSRVATAVNEVIRSYEDADPNHQVLIQAMLHNVAVHGVVLTRTLGQGAPYYTVNFDDSTGQTDTVTGGGGENLRTVLIHREHGDMVSHVDPQLSPVLKAITELEDLLRHDSLDVEFAVTADGTVNVLQVRCIAEDSSQNRIDDSVVRQALEVASESFRSQQMPGPGVVGQRTIFGVMPDWNPAEMIGTKPHRLASTLYQYLITDEIWAVQRAEYGYRDLRPHKLLSNFVGHPYVDVRASFNSFIPSTLSDGLAQKLVNHYVKRLAAEPHLHDKIEFQVAFTCLAFDFDVRAECLKEDGLTDSEIAALREALARITSKAPAQCAVNLGSIDRLMERYEKLMSADMDPLRVALELLEDCRRYGNLPFAHLARAAFVGISLLRSLESTAVISSAQMNNFLESLKTVAGDATQAGHDVAEGRLTWEGFVSRYGHLRPGTYEVLSSTYASEPDRYLRPMVVARPTELPIVKQTSYWDEETRASIGAALHSLGLDWSIAEFESFLRQAIEGREYAKFVFTRNLSMALELLVQAVSAWGIERAQLSHIGIQDLLSLHSGQPLPDVGSWLAERADEGARWHLLAQAVELPELLVEPEDFYVFEKRRGQPNFVTRHRVTAEVSDLGSVTNREVNIADKIVLIPQADPGFDWLFSHPIAGLVTMRGGSNSHMTIRAAEFGIPAAIGVGELLYEQLVLAQLIELDCDAQSIRMIR